MALAKPEWFVDPLKELAGAPGALEVESVAWYWVVLENANPKGSRSYKKGLLV